MYIKIDKKKRVGKRGKNAKTVRGRGVGGGAERLHVQPYREDQREVVLIHPSAPTYSKQQQVLAYVLA